MAGGDSGASGAGEPLGEGPPDGLADGLGDGSAGLDVGDGLGTRIVGVGYPGVGELVGGSSIGAGLAPDASAGGADGAAVRDELVEPLDGCGQTHPIAAQSAGRLRKLVVMNTFRKSPLIAPSTESGNG